MFQNPISQRNGEFKQVFYISLVGSYLDSVWRVFVWLLCIPINRFIDVFIYLCYCDLLLCALTSLVCVLSPKVMNVQFELALSPTLPPTLSPTESPTVSHCYLSAGRIADTRIHTYRG